ncbi:CD109 antigen-like [Lucilia sericata]|uniref:CD109 antigen-like n=1 Tax=Lucilia sericata TaxID=13632 RepID=UPI0018A8761F|nr:CD109 antigen-like [Lucilia sericata]
MQPFFINLYLFLLYMVLAVSSENYYSINAPGVIKSNHKYSVIVTLHEASGPCSIRVGVDGPGFKEYQDVNLEPFESKLLNFMPKRISSGDYTLSAEGLSDCSFKNSSRLHVDTSYGPKIFIQTDKGIYKPQDVVNFRIVILDEHTRPLNITEPVHVEILDDENNRVKQFRNVSLKTGVYTGKLKLSKYPVLGTWSIKVVLCGSYDYSSFKYIQIDNYVLPKFSVYLKTPSHVILQDGYIKVVIFGKYTFYKHVEGNATVELWHEKVKLQTKHIDIEHLGFVEFNIKNETTINNAKRLKVKAKLSEKSTSRTESNYQYIYLHQQRYNLQIPDNDIEFENNKPYRLKVLVKHWTGAAVLDHKTPITMEHGNKTYESFLDENGAAIFEFEHDANDDHRFQFKDTKVMLPNIYSNENLMLNNREYYCRLRLVDEKLKLGKPVLIEVSSIISIPYLTYIIMGHASIINMEHIKLPPNQKSYVINITASIDMIPDSFVYVYYVHKNNLRYEEIHLNFPHEFENQITLSAPKQVKPGEEVTISINAQPKSYVSLLAVDLGISVLDKTYDLNKGEIIKHLVSVRSYSPIAASVYPGIMSGLVTLTNAHYTFQRLSDGGRAKTFLQTMYKYREHFPETWIFNELVINETDTKLTLPIPEAITTWRITAFSNNDVTGFAIVDAPTDITTIQSFFITLNLPYSVKRGGTVPITIFNYSNQTLYTEVVLHNNDQEFYFIDSEMLGVKESNDSQRKIEQISVPKDKAKTVKFLIYLTKVGDVSLKATASNSLYTDAIQQNLKWNRKVCPNKKIRLYT